MKKQIFWIILALILLIGGGTACNSNISLNSQKEDVLAAADRITSIQLPGGYEPEFNARLLDYELVSFRSDNDISHLYLLQSSAADDQENLENMLNRMVPEQEDSNTRMTIIETKSIEARGAMADYVLSEGTNSQGVTYRQALLSFDGENGAALLVFSEPVSIWDAERVADLIESLE